MLVCRVWPDRRPASPSVHNQLTHSNYAPRRAGLGWAGPKHSGSGRASHSSLLNLFFSCLTFRPPDVSVAGEGAWPSLRKVSPVPHSSLFINSLIFLASCQNRSKAGPGQQLFHSSQSWWEWVRGAGCRDTDRDIVVSSHAGITR